MQNAAAPLFQNVVPGPLLVGGQEVKNRPSLDAVVLQDVGHRSFIMPPVPGRNGHRTQRPDLARKSPGCVRPLHQLSHRIILRSDYNIYNGESRHTFLNTKRDKVFNQFLEFMLPTNKTFVTDINRAAA
jgi:hypothetical protein